MHRLAALIHHGSKWIFGRIDGDDGETEAGEGEVDVGSGGLSDAGDDDDTGVWGLRAGVSGSNGGRKRCGFLGCWVLEKIGGGEWKGYEEECGFKESSSREDIATTTRRKRGITLRRVKRFSLEKGFQRVEGSGEIQMMENSRDREREREREKEGMEGWRGICRRPGPESVAAAGGGGKSPPARIPGPSVNHKIQPHWKLVVLKGQPEFRHTWGRYELLET
ncbi:hypothetical protein MRB53_018355 [Persea americana]|uniref:Uncharacterized protein n=1 Tax=Persea americana TaxID=3435 RepID=A0ACC2M8K9_PERAE|nr:hypothetical protein MRB53_018355 [Persea americana]